MSLVTNAKDEVRSEGDTLVTTLPCDEGTQWLLCLVAVDDESLAFPHLGQVRRGIGRTVDFWSSGRRPCGTTARTGTRSCAASWPCSC